MEPQEAVNRDRLGETASYWRQKTPEERLDAVERYRLEARKCLYEYPTRLRRLLTVKADVEELR
mgnify:CR=1 FL=1